MVLHSIERSRGGKHIAVYGCFASANLGDCLHSGMEQPGAPIAFLISSSYALQRISLLHERPPLRILHPSRLTTHRFPRAQRHPRTKDQKLPKSQPPSIHKTTSCAKTLYLRVSKPKRVAERTGLEPATSNVTGWRSNQLNYRSRLVL